MPSARNWRSGTVDARAHEVGTRAVWGTESLRDGSLTARIMTNDSREQYRVGRRAVFESFDQESEAALGFPRPKSSAEKTLGLHVASMDTI